MGFSPTPQPRYSSGSKHDPTTTEIIIICSLSIGLPLLCFLCYLYHARWCKWCRRREPANASPVPAAPVTTAPTQHTVEMPVIYAATVTDYSGERDVITR